jgi:predicted CopG family antitoxin
MKKIILFVVLIAVMIVEGEEESAETVKTEREGVRKNVYIELAKIKDEAKRTSISNVIFNAIADYEREAKKNPRLVELMVTGVKMDKEIEKLMKEEAEGKKKGEDVSGVREKMQNLRAEQRRMAQELEEIFRDTPGLAGWRKSSEVLQEEWRKGVISDELMDLLMREGMLCNKYLYLLHREKKNGNM